MRNLLALIGLIVVLFLAVGYARNWYSFDITTDRDGKVKISGDIDSVKIRQDGSKTLDKAGDAIDSLRKKGDSSDSLRKKDDTSATQPLVGPPAPRSGQ